MEQNQDIGKALWDDPIEENQWAVVRSKTNESSPEGTAIYVREKPPPAAVRVWFGNGERNEWEEEAENRSANKPFEEQGLAPFLFGTLERSRFSSEFGKLDDESKAMLEEKYNVDVGTDG